ncbi:hypothetical protein ABB37_04198 [Leptomonas pyrrhocoris]|uniref:Uncharacterized protein n=1 Tax=Leptomonas pyrrhocoris TaxID=157538 RepID=A0A0M9G2C5_LEPPY|nr:hypothetical protein ABB37_04198 [Leptomonas pyrrhocoris]XP_015659176.1 hypothetical protein ABB37_04198 [Leptomonas pyrrhocoris]KPA80736.1 hypothetical protein ABB37_04198 [Leptomonas pyrrhocoris]KPA80737.1 hypothetical protein ABB37_04198 [Leptomonas pyrrhocoris]|eukprot:XP_015659175.1 hypothetical protein ABB37_04198 [Leptomonas pyrrhocoris]
MEKPSIKHLDFQLQREKARSRDLEVECKALHTQIAQLEQDKAGLRREKLVLSEEAKKISKLDDRVHLLQKDIESRDAIIASERAAAEQARAETEEVRNNANASIAQWVDAEKQWTSEQAALNEAAMQFRGKIEEMEASLHALKTEHAETTRLLDVERERAKKLTEARDALEAEVRSFHSQAEKLQTKICDLEQTIYKLDLAGDKQRETIDLKDTEIRTLEAALENEHRTVERMEQTISSLNDRINAVKMVSLGEKGENEKLQCDISDARKEIARLNLHVESLKRDANFSAQSQAGLQKALDEMREKCRMQQEDLKEKSVEIRRQELTISQLNAELKKSENQGGEWSFQNSSLEAELQRAKDALKTATSVTETFALEKDDLALKARQLQSIIESKDEEMVLLQNQSEEKVEVLTQDVRNLEKEVAARQGVINDLTEQLNSTSEKNAKYYAKVLEESEIAGKVRQELSQMLSHAHAKERELHFCNCVAEKSHLFSAWLSEWYAFPQTQTRALFDFWQNSQREAAEQRQQLFSLSQKMEEATRTISTQDEVVLQKERLITEMQQESARKAHEVEELAAMNAGNKACIEGLQAELNEATQRIDTLSREAELLNQQLIMKEAALSENDALRAETHSCALADLSAASDLQSCALNFCSEQADHLHSLWSSRVETLVDFFVTTLAGAHEEKTQLSLAKRQAESTCRELTAFVKEAKVAMSKGDNAVAEKQESLMSRITLLEGQRALSHREKEQATTQLSALLRRFEDEQKAHESFKRESQIMLEAEQAKSAAAEKNSAKLRAAINYEVSRKCEYKAALEEVKRRFGESEEMRVAESARALEAIKKANGESNYWVMCFDRLKKMVEQSRKSGKRLPSIDADTIHRLEEAKTSIAPMQAQDVNFAVSDAPKLKRLRDEATGASR